MAMTALAGSDVDAVTPGPNTRSPVAGNSGAPHVTVVAERPQLTLGSDDSVGLGIEVSGFPPGLPLTVRGFTNVGSLDPPVPGATPGRFVGRYVTPAEQFPQLA
jgi:hypothetical protein